MQPLVGDGGMMMLNHPWGEPLFGRDQGYLRAIKFDPRVPIGERSPLLQRPAGHHRNLDWTIIEIINGSDMSELMQARTLWHALLICVGLFVLMAGVFTRPQLVLEPGVAQIAAMLLILIAAIGVIFALQAQFSDRRGIDIPARLVLAAIALTALFHPERQIAWLSCLPIGLFVGYWLLRRRGNRAEEPQARPG